MNRYVYSAMICAALAGCAKTVQPSAPEEGQEAGKFTIEAGLPSNAEVKTSLGEKGATTAGVYDILWQTGDRISVNGIVSDPLGEADNGSVKGHFTFGSEPEAPYMVLYPAQDGSSKTLTVPAEQTYRAGSFDPAAAPMYGYSTEIGQVSLHNLTCTVRLQFKGGDTIDRIILSANSGESLAGDLTLGTGSDGFDGSFEFGAGASSSLTVSFGSGLQLSSTPVSVHIPVLAGTYSSGLTAKVYDKEGKYMQLKFWGTGKTAAGDKLYEFPETTYNPGRAEVLMELEEMEVEESFFDTKITVGCYNIWSLQMRQKYYDDRNDSGAQYYISGDGAFVDNDPRLWSNAKPYVAKAIVDCGYDAIGVCEIYNDTQKSDLQNAVTAAGGNFTWHFFKLNGSNGNAGYEAIAYNPDILTETGSGQFWLTEFGDGSTPSKYPSIAHLGWEEGNYRMVSYSFLQHKVTGKTLMFCHCHAPLNDDYNTWSGSFIKSHINSKNTGNRPVVFVGDLNSCPNASENNNGDLFGSLAQTWNHAYTEADKAGLLTSAERTNNCTWAGERGQKSMLRSEDHPFKHQLDHVFYSDEFTILNYWTNRSTHKEPYSLAASGYRNFFPSDHMPVVAELAL